METLAKCIFDAQVVNYQNVRILTSGKNGLSKKKKNELPNHVFTHWFFLKMGLDLGWDNKTCKRN
jgi:hypothetical protein